MVMMASLALQSLFPDTEVHAKQTLLLENSLQTKPVFAWLIVLLINWFSAGDVVSYRDGNFQGLLRMMRAACGG